MTVGVPAAGGWRLGAPEAVGAPQTLLPRLRARAGGRAVAFGIDCPLGVPRAYAEQLTGWTDFPGFLRGLAGMDGFFQVAAALDAVSLAAPFYPARGAAGMTRLAHARALGLADAAALSRACDRATPERPAGAPVFWTLGANQSGKAALAAWRDMLIPALLKEEAIALWPFDGPFLSLLRPGAVAMAETYPAEAMRHLGLPARGSKRRQADRAAHGPGLMAAMARLGVQAAPALASAVADGFGSGEDGEDQFDSTLGVLCVIGVLRGIRTDTAPDDPWITRWEGWVLGQRTADG